MGVNKEAYQEISAFCKAKNVTLVAVSKLKTPADILELYNLGHRDFGENYVQELVEKAPQLPTDIRWHFIGHLQRNKVKYIAPFVHLIQVVESVPLLQEISKQAAKNNRVIPVLLQVHIADEESKFGIRPDALKQVVDEVTQLNLTHIELAGLMGLASATDDMEKVKSEFAELRNAYEVLQKNVAAKNKFSVLSMGMSGDYNQAIAAGSTMIRIGSLLFGARSAKA